MSDDVRADAREALAHWAKYGVAGTSDVEEVAPALMERLLAELDHEQDRALLLAIRATGREKAETERDAALATLQQVRELRREWGTKDYGPRVYEMWKALGDILDGGAR